MFEEEALDAILLVLKDAEWNRPSKFWYLNTLQRISDAVRSTGRVISDFI